jgi:benzoate membrane transport protein
MSSSVVPIERPGSGPEPDGPEGRGRATIQSVSAGLLVAVVGFASSFTVVLRGLAGVGATPAQAASGLLALLVVLGSVAVLLSLASRMPISTAWSTPGAALLAASGVPVGGFSAATGAFLVTAALIVAAGLWRPFGRAVAAIPIPLAAAMLAGILLDLCLAPVRAAGAMPQLALPIIIVWAVTWRFARLYAVPAAVVVTGLIIVFATSIPAEALVDIWPHPVWVTPTFNLEAIVSLSVPLFIVTMASQNVPGLAVLNANGYNPPVGPIFVVTGLGSAITALFGGHMINLAAITAALCAGPEGGPDPSRRWIAGVTGGFGYIVLGLGATFAASFVAASPPLLIQAVAGLALLGTLGSSLHTALSREDDRLAAVVAFVTSASGVSAFGIGAAFWGLLAGGLMMLLGRRPASLR